MTYADSLNPALHKILVSGDKKLLWNGMSGRLHSIQVFLLHEKEKNTAGS